MKYLITMTLSTICLLALAKGEPMKTNIHSDNGEYVVLLHGLARTSNSMGKMQKALSEAGYRTCNIGYPSTKATVEELATFDVLPAIRECVPDSATRLSFVTHSMGGIILRQLVADGRLKHVGRVVMLGPPNGGSEVADKLKHNWAYRWANGPAGDQLGTRPEDVPKRLGSVDFELGVIAGNRSINPILSMMIPGPDDGKVSIENAKLDGMRDFLVLETTHTFMMRNRRTIAEVLHFLEHGGFSRRSRAKDDVSAGSLSKDADLR